MNIAILASSFLPSIGGAEVAIHNLALQFRKMGHRVHVITWWGNWVRIRGQLPYSVLPLLPRSHTDKDRDALENQGKPGPGVGRQVRFYRRLFSLDVVNIQIGSPFGPLCVPALSRARVPVVMTCQGWDLLRDAAMRYGVRLNPVHDRVLTDAIRACDLITSTSPLMDAEYLGMGVPKDRILRIPNGADVSRIRAAIPAGRSLREKHGIPADAKLLLTVGRNVRFKGFDYIPKILRRLLDAGRDPWWVVVGAETEGLRALGEQEGVGSRLVTIPTIGMAIGEGWTGRLCGLPPDEVIQWYRTADLYVHPAIVEPFGNIVVESMAAGLPLVVTDGTGSAECVEKAGCGWVAKSRDVQDLADKIGRLIEDAPLRREMAVRARDGAVGYDWPAVAKQYVAAYERAIRDRRMV